MKPKNPPETIKVTCHVILVPVNIFQVQSAKLKEMHDFIIIPILSLSCNQEPPKPQNCKYFFNLPPELQIFLKL